MPTLNTSSLWRLEEAPELLTDGYVLDGDRAIFVSLWAVIRPFRSCWPRWHCLPVRAD